MGMKAKSIAQTIRVENWYYVEPGDGSQHFTQCTQTHGPLATFTNPCGYELEADVTDPKVKIYDDLTPVIFRVWKDGDVIAIFPTEPADDRGNVSCYMHLGQHGSTGRNVVWETRLAKPEEYADLQKELESEPYNYRFHIIKRWR